MDQEIPVWAQGVALFACSGRGLFEMLVLPGLTFENQVSIGPVPDLFQLAHLASSHETMVVALVDTNTTRLFVTRLGALEERDGPDDPNTRDYRKRAMGGWSQARYQRHIDKHRRDFAREAATAIERPVDREGATLVLLAGDEVAVPLLRAALSDRVAALIHGKPLRLDIRAPRDSVLAEIAPILDRVAADVARCGADRLIAAVREDGLGVAGLARTSAALEQGRAERLLLAAEVTLPHRTRAELIRLAARTGADVEVVEQHAGLQALGGVGALLRYRLLGQDEPQLPLSKHRLDDEPTSAKPAAAGR
jgi:hypothetical protein